ncbi:MAG: BlaI/MecI/CopY family transcriptional regulator [Oscillospiraceae bacterium]|nr:BlaI/MecI/CopY family transcriptional regulator [Oscillospiraceae bacterium]
MSILKQLPDTEYAIMQIIWEMEIPTTTARVAAVAEPLKGWHYKTTQTLLRRLMKKGFLSSEKKDGDLYYTPMVTKDEYTKMETELFMEKIHGKSLKGFISTLYSDKKPSNADLAEIEEWFKNRKQP